MGESNSDICFPISDISEVLNWYCDKKCWSHMHKVVLLKNKTKYVNSGHGLDLRVKCDVYPEFKLASKLLPKTIFCHDYKGGYINDRYCKGCPDIDTYRFFNWAGIDIFIYFSHNLVTIPTQGWLNAGHVHGVPVLGTLITEWEEGEAIWKDILTSNDKIDLFSKRLAEICAHFGFDGYLLNVENVIPIEFIPRLVRFVALLKAHLNLCCENETWLIWYDSVTTEGKLAWQNKLCTLNKPFFDACDGIFLNYVWKPADLLESLEVAGPRKFDVYVGIDTWGRNCYQDGGWNVDKAMAVLRSLNMSVALFAPAWTEETLPPGEIFLTRELTFWRLLKPYLYLHGPASLPFFTNFCQGISFDKETGDPWFNLAMQQYQTTTNCCSTNPTPENSCVSLHLEDGFKHNGACLRVTATSVEHSKIFHRVFVCDFTNVQSESCTLLVSLALKGVEFNSAQKFRIYFVLEDKLSIEGKQDVSMKTRPKGYRASKQLSNLSVTGSVIDFSLENQSAETKIKVNEVDSTQNSWHIIEFLLDLSAGVSLTEILLLPALQGSVLWSYLKIEITKVPK